MGRKRPPRLSGFDYLGCHAYFLTICAENGAPFAGAPKIADAVCAELLRTAADYRFATIAYCLMPDHLHALLEGQEDRSDFQKFAAMIKQRTSFRLSARLRDATVARGLLRSRAPRRRVANRCSRIHREQSDPRRFVREDIGLRVARVGPLQIGRVDRSGATRSARATTTFDIATLKGSRYGHGVVLRAAVVALRTIPSRVVGLHDE
jgi:REP element-mobilizing transposase RayT